MQNDNSKIKNNKKHEDSGKQNDTKDTSKNETVHLKQKIEELENQVKRIFADYQNLEKRVALEKREWLIKANGQLLLNLLPILDTLVLADKHSKVEDQNLKISINQFLDILKNEGVVRIETKEKDFDPLIMECVETRRGEDWKVLEEVKAGYKLGDMILRPALVVVGKKGDSETSSE